MRLFCREAHNRLVAHPASRTLAVKIFPLPPQQLRDHLEQKTFFIDLLEQLILKARDTSWAGDERMCKMVDFFKKIFRAAAIRKTIEYLDREKGTVPRGVVTTTLDYGHHLAALAETPSECGLTGVFLVGHAYVNFLDGIYGGILVGNSIRTRLGDGAAQYLAYPFLYAPGTSMKDANPTVEAFVKDGFEDPLDRLPLTEADVRRLNVEARTAFEFHLRLCDELVARDSGGATKRYAALAPTDGTAHATAPITPVPEGSAPAAPAATSAPMAP